MTEQTPETPKPAGAGARREGAHAGPPVEQAKEVLNSHGQASLHALQRVAAGQAMTSGGRDDIPWIKVRPEHLVSVAERCKSDRELHMDMLHCLLAVDYVEHIEVVYILFSMQTGSKGMLKVDLPASAPRVGTVTGLWEAASWYEREAHDLFGVEFVGNDDMEPLLLFHGFEGHPGLKSFPLHEFEEW